MQCHQCGRTVTASDRFCGGCGASLAGITDATEPMGAIPTDAPAPAPATPRPPAEDAPPSEAGPVWETDPVWATTGQLPATEPIAPPLDPPTNPALPIAEQIEPLPTEGAWPIPDAEVTQPYGEPTGVMVSTTAQMPMVPTAISEPLEFRPGAVSALALLGAIVAMVATFATIVSVSSSQRIIPTAETPVAFRTGTWVADDLAGNLSIAMLVAVAAMLGGGVAAAFGWRGGAGLAGGSGLAITGMAALVIGLAQVPIDAAYDMAAIPTENRFTLTITRDLGYWLQIAAGAVGLVVFFASINEALSDRRRGLNPWIAALGALSAVVLAFGPLLPEQLGRFSDNWYVTEAPGTAPAMLLTGRIIQLALIAVAGLVGFLSVRRWGLGVAIGGALPAMWLVLSTMLELTDGPVGPGYLNPGATELRVHGVTIIGASAVLAFGVLAIVAAYDQSRHDW